MRWSMPVQILAVLPVPVLTPGSDVRRALLGFVIRRWLHMFSFGCGRNSLSF